MDTLAAALSEAVPEGRGLLLLSTMADSDVGNAEPCVFLPSEVDLGGILLQSLGSGLSGTCTAGAFGDALDPARPSVYRKPIVPGSGVVSPPTELLVGVQPRTGLAYGPVLSSDGLAGSQGSFVRTCGTADTIALSRTQTLAVVVVSCGPLGGLEAQRTWRGALQAVGSARSDVGLSVGVTITLVPGGGVASVAEQAVTVVRIMDGFPVSSAVVTYDGLSSASVDANVQNLAGVGELTGCFSALLRSGDATAKFHLLHR